MGIASAENLTIHILGLQGFSRRAATTGTLWAVALSTDDAVIEVLSSDMTWPGHALHEPEQSGFWARLVLGEPLGSVHLILTETCDQAESLAVRLAH